MSKLVEIEGFTILCWNCNCAKKYGKFCMHSENLYNKYNKKLVSYMNKIEKDKYEFLLKELII